MVVFRTAPMCLIWRRVLQTNVTEHSWSAHIDGDILDFLLIVFFRFLAKILVDLQRLSHFPSVLHSRSLNEMKTATRHGLWVCVNYISKQRWKTTEESQLLQGHNKVTVFDIGVKVKAVTSLFLVVGAVV